MDENLNIWKNSKKIPVFPSVFLGIVILLSLGFFITNITFEKSINSLQEEISQMQNNIDAIKRDNTKKDFQVYDSLSYYYSNFKKMEQNNRVVEYIDHLNKVWRQKSLSFSGFSMNNWEIKSNVSVRATSLSKHPYERISDFIKEYRNDPEALFDLNFIKSFDWMDEMKFAVDFKIKETKAKTISENNLNDNITENE